MKSMTISTRIDEPTKTAFSQVCEEVGLSPSQAIQLFAKAVVNYGGIPFEIKVPKPNAVTMKAIQAFDSTALDGQNIDNPSTENNNTLQTAEDFSQFLTNLDIDSETKSKIIKQSNV